MLRRILTTIIFIVTILASAGHLFCPVNYAANVVRAESGPDLTVAMITSSPEAPTIGDEVTFSITISNQGTAASGQCYVAYYIDGDYLDHNYVPPIDPGASSQHSFTWTAETGMHVVKAVADYTQQISEIDEGNNEKTYTFSTLGPDLIIDSITWSPSEPPVASIVIFTVNIKNQGSIEAKSGHVHFYIDDISQGHKGVERIGAGETRPVTFSWFTKAGPHDIKAIVDRDDSVREIDESNNELTILFSALLPDLIIKDISWSPVQPALSDNVTFTILVTNQGNGVSGIPAIDLYVNDRYLATEWLDELEAGASENVTFSWIAKPGTHDIKAVVTLGAVFPESDETNNEKTVILTPLLADLIIEDIAWSPANAWVGDNVTFTVTVKNQGGGGSLASRVDLRVDGVSKGHELLNPVDAGGTDEVTFTWLAKAGSHQIRATADRRREVKESDETNNEKTVILSTPPPDLIIEQITWAPSEATIGDEVTLTVKVKNQGDARSDFAYVAYYVDDNRVASDRVNMVSPNATDNQTFTWTITAREHVIRAFADFTETVDETDETNNEKTVTLSPALADLIVESIDWSLNNPLAGETVTFSVTTANNGAYRSGASLVRLYIDNKPMGYQDIPEIDPGGRVTRTFDWKVAEGSHAIRAVIDDSDLVIESDEANNETLIAYPLPDLAIEALTWSPVEPAMGDKVTLTAYVKNKGSLNAGGSQVYFYVNDNVANYQEIPPLEAGARVTRTFEWDVAAGPHILTLFADGANAITEGAESNNQEKVTFSTPAPDLIIESITWPSEEASASDNVVFTVTIKNQGDIKSRYASVNYYVDGQYLASGQVRSLKPDADTEEVFSTWISRTGPHTIRVVIDEGNQVPESNEANNEKMVTFSTENITPPGEKPASGAQTTRPAPTPLTPPEREHKAEMMFIISVVIFGGILVLTLLWALRRKKEKKSSDGWG